MRSPQGVGAAHAIVLGGSGLDDATRCLEARGTRRRATVVGQRDRAAGQERR
jgi:hypothetical protein